MFSQWRVHHHQYNSWDSISQFLSTFWSVASGKGDGNTKILRSNEVVFDTHKKREMRKLGDTFAKKDVTQQILRAMLWYVAYTAIYWHN